jgi:hypothetical protein
VIYDPQPGDDAHANLVVCDQDMDNTLTVVAALLGCLVWVPADHIGDVAELCRSASGTLHGRLDDARTS